MKKRTQVRDCGCLVRLTKDEQRLLEDIAASEGMPLASWVRRSALRAAAAETFVKASPLLGRKYAPRCDGMPTP